MAAHFLESWSDARAYDGTVSIVQPLIDPLYGGKTAHDVFQVLLNEPGLSAYEAVRETWKPVIKGDFETGWRKALHQGWIDSTAFKASDGATKINLPLLGVPVPSSPDASDRKS